MILRPRETSCKKLNWPLYTKLLPKHVITMLRATESEALTKEACLPNPRVLGILSNIAKYGVPVERGPILCLETLAKHDGSRCSLLQRLYTFKRQHCCVKSDCIARKHSIRTDESRKSRTYDWNLGDRRRGTKQCTCPKTRMCHNLSR